MKASRQNGHGCLIVIEGIDGAGKTTLARSIYTRLINEGIPAVLTSEPTDGPWGRQLRLSLSAAERLTPEEELRLFIRDRQEHIEKVIYPSLREGRVVVCDRYYFSTMAYQGARGLDPEAIRRENEAFAPRPDLVFLLEIDPDVALRRIKYGRPEAPDRFEQLAYLKVVKRLFEGITDSFVVHINASIPPEALLDQVWERILTSIFG